MTICRAIHFLESWRALAGFEGYQATKERMKVMAAQYCSECTQSRAERRLYAIENLRVYR